MENIAPSICLIDERLTKLYTFTNIPAVNQMRPYFPLDIQILNVLSKHLRQKQPEDYHQSSHLVSEVIRKARTLIWPNRLVGIFHALLYAKTTSTLPATHSDINTFDNL